MGKNIKEWLSVHRAKNPGGVVLGVILLFNIVLFLTSALIISSFPLRGTETMSFIEAAFYTVMMVLDAGCVEMVVADIGQTNVVVTIVCLTVVIVSMVTFTGAVIGYITNYISSFIDNANRGKHPIYMNDHMVILNWNSRASEIVNDLLYKDERQKVVILVDSRKEEIEREVEERITDTVLRENKQVEAAYAHLPWLRRKLEIARHRFRSNLTVFVREGDVFSSKQLEEISLPRAKTIIILGDDAEGSLCRYGREERAKHAERGNSRTVKTLMQVAEITGGESSADHQRVVVEITDEWTWELVSEIIRAKEVEGKSHIVPIRVNRVLGQILSQFSLMPALNRVYAELFSNRGVEIYTSTNLPEDRTLLASRLLAQNRYVIPLTVMNTGSVDTLFYAAEHKADLSREGVPVSERGYRVALNPEYWIEHKNVIILGHNSKSRDIMQGFSAFCGEWNREGEPIVSVAVIDDARDLEKMDYYRAYPFVTETVTADVFDREIVCQTLERWIVNTQGDLSILILSDDTVVNDDVDAAALANLIHVQQILSALKENSEYNLKNVDIVVEIVDPKHHDIVNSYDVNNVVISNRYVSKMIGQIGEVDALFDFYTDILTYDEGGRESMEFYAKKVSRFFREVPAPCTAEELVRAVLAASLDESLPAEKRIPTIVLGYVDAFGRTTIFGGDQANIQVELTSQDKLIVFAPH